MTKLLVVGSLLILSQTAFGGVEVIYGPDDRKDIYQVSNALHLQLAKSTAGMVHKGMFAKGSSANTFDIMNAPTLERAENVCTSEKFSQQPLAPMCSGFLVGPDTLVTAGHCYNTFDLPENVCKNFAWVFDYSLKTANTNPTKNISIANIYSCKSVINVKRDENFDFSIIKLDRPVVGRQPLKFRTSGKVGNSDNLIVIGHPTGLPTKITSGNVTSNAEVTRFSTNLDTFHGNSGSAVFNANNGQVEGILVMGKNDYIPSIPSNPKSCKVNNKCDNTAQNCSAGFEGGPIEHGEAVLRIEKIASLITKALLVK